MIKIIITIIVALLPLTLFASIDPQTILKGQSTTIYTDYEIGDVAVANISICDYLVAADRRSIYLNGRKNGETTVTLWTEKGKRADEFHVRVVSSTLKEIYDGALQSFSNVEGVDVKLKDRRVDIDGEIADPEDYRSIDDFAKGNSIVRNNVRITKEITGKIASSIKEEVDVPGLKVRPVQDKIVLEGTVYSSTDKNRAVEIAKLYYPHVIDLIDVKQRDRVTDKTELVELEFHMMEVKKSALKNFGVNWAPGSFPAGSGNASTGSGEGLFGAIGDMGKSLLGFVFQLVPKIKFISEKGEGRVLENPSIVVKSGEKARVFSGSEIPYYRNDEVQFKKVGIDIEAEPIVVGDGVDIRLSATLSAPSADIRGAVDTNTVFTTAVCPFGQSLIVGNIVRNGDVKMKNRVPRDVDTSSALFTLFLSKDFQSNRSEFVIFVTPKIVQKPRPAEEELKKYLEMERAMISDRSKKEYERYIALHDGKALPNVKASRKRKWR